MLLPVCAIQLAGVCSNVGGVCALCGLVVLWGKGVWDSERLSECMQLTEWWADACARVSCLQYVCNLKRRHCVCWLAHARACVCVCVCACACVLHIVCMRVSLFM
jgi:hypothetical protein